MLFTKSCENTGGSLMESRRAFVTRKDVGKQEGAKVRYIYLRPHGCGKREDRTKNTTPRYVYQKMAMLPEGFFIGKEVTRPYPSSIGKGASMLRLNFPPCPSPDSNTWGFSFPTI